jgi:hypothetical protein
MMSRNSKELFDPPMHYTMLRLACALVLVGNSPSLFADPITIVVGNPGNQNTDAVLFTNGSLIHSGLLVQGDFAGIGSGFIVDFTSASGSGTSVSVAAQRCSLAERVARLIQMSPSDSKTGPHLPS